ncbi:hypothetical protein QO010_003187 [Caulobacter ginsengisoli]|uniref:DUF2306 domain-containing protein n=1 Tax=Caulobacter ginsengisoli TaxID=400775 RepID=A0ABU0ITS0_9CAUL|nr:DUF2306 domain-containing protein [Caulobacter ginsengisoli]MDQ0465400.1 hypothetical protein [Caulobacter ginsengisoli]
MIRRLAPLSSAAWRAALVLLTAQVAWSAAARYLVGSETPPQVIVENTFASPVLVIHVAASIVALAIAPLQFVAAIRRRWPGFHRLNGRLYLLACAIGAPAGFVLAFGVTAGPVAGLGFSIPAVLWPLFTWLGWRAAVERRFGDHRAWMLRSYAVLAGAITLRLMLPFSGLVLGIDFFPAYRVISWLSWSANLVLAEAYIRFRRAPAVTYAPS